MKEVKAVILSLNGDSTNGLNDFLGQFFQVCWDIIEEDLTKFFVVDNNFLDSLLTQILFSSLRTNLLLASWTQGLWVRVFFQTRSFLECYMKD